MVEIKVLICEKCAEIHNIKSKKILCRRFCTICGEHDWVCETIAEFK